MAADLTHRLAELFRWADPSWQDPDPDPLDNAWLFSDASGWWRDADVLARIGPALAAPFRADPPTVVISPEVTGLLLGPLVAVALGVGFVPAYKRESKRLFGEPISWAETSSDHFDRSLAIGVRSRHLRPGDRVLVVDDWVETGAQVRALHEIVAACGAASVGTATVVADCSPELARELRLHALLTAGDIPS